MKSRSRVLQGATEGARFWFLDLDALWSLDPGSWSFFKGRRSPLRIPPIPSRNRRSPPPPDLAPRILRTWREANRLRDFGCLRAWQNRFTRPLGFRESRKLSNRKHRLCRQTSHLPPTLLLESQSVGQRRCLR